MGRPREHDEATRLALLEAAEALVAAGGPEALSVRAVADTVGTTTRAVYTLFGSKSGLLSALAQRSFELLAARISELPVSDDPFADLVEASVRVFRPMATEHPSLFRLAFLRVVPDLDLTDDTRRASHQAFELLCSRFERLAAAGQLPHHAVEEAATIFNALCEGMATTELRRHADGDGFEATWRRAFEALLTGFGDGPSGRTHGRRRST